MEKIVLKQQRLFSGAFPVDLIISLFPYPFYILLKLFTFSVQPVTNISLFFSFFCDNLNNVTALSDITVVQFYSKKAGSKLQILVILFWNNATDHIY